MERSLDTSLNKVLASDKILMAALEIAQARGWANVRMCHIAAHLNAPLAELRELYPDMNAIADAWFSYALAEMLSVSEKTLRVFAVKERLFIVITRWLEALDVNHRVSVQMIRQKLYAVHVQHWAPMIFSLSNLVHWILDAAMIDSAGRQRKLEEIGMTLILLETLRVWGEDNTVDQIKTREFLKKRLDMADRTMRFLFLKCNPKVMDVQPTKKVKL